MIADPSAVFFSSAAPDGTEVGRENYIRVSSGYFKIHAFARDQVTVLVFSSLTVCLVRRYRSARTQNDRLGEIFPTLRSTCDQVTDRTGHMP